jgi:phage shock protein C
MKKTVYINLNGYAFHIEEDAYQKLKDYLDKIERSFLNEDEAKEIVSDMEARIAELFRGKHPSADEVIALENVEEVIKTMGEPHDIIDDDFQEESDAKTSSADNTPGYRKRLYRDPENSVFGGVCSGLGAYFNIDPLVFRIIFLLSFILYGVSFFAYIIMWIVMPKAVTITQKLEMKGPADYEKWEKNLRREYEGVSKRMKKSKVYKDLNTGLATSSDLLGDVLRGFIKVIGIIIGLVFMIVALSGLISMLLTLIFGYTLFDFSDLGNYYSALPVYFLEASEITTGIIALVLFIGIPFLTIFYWGFRMVFNFKTRVKYISLLGMILWGAGWILLFYTAAHVARNYANIEETYEKISLDRPSLAKTIYLKPNVNTIPSELNEHLFDLNKLDVYATEDKIYVQGIPDISAQKGDDLSLDVRKTARGRNAEDARENASGIEYFWIQKDSVIYIDPIFTIADGKKIRDQKARVIISIPDGYQLDVDDELKWLVSDHLE